MEEILPTSWYSKYPVIYKVLYIPGGAGFLPSTVSITYGFLDFFPFLDWKNPYDSLCSVDRHNLAKQLIHYLFGILCSIFPTSCYLVFLPFPLCKIEVVCPGLAYFCASFGQKITYFRQLSYIKSCSDALDFHAILYHVCSWSQVTARWNSAMQKFAHVWTNNS